MFFFFSFEIRYKRDGLINFPINFGNRNESINPHLHILRAVYNLLRRVHDFSNMSWIAEWEFDLYFVSIVY